MLFFICLFDSVLDKLVYFSRVAFVFSRLILIKAWRYKRGGGPENGLFDSVSDIGAGRPCGY